MQEDSPKHTDDAIEDGIGQRVDPAPAEESLSEALNGLEQILERRRRGRPDAVPPVADAAESAHADAQYTIPLLHDVVVPGDDEPSARVPGHAEPPAPESDLDEEQAWRTLSERLANEIEVIVQARVETALQEAAEDIREQVRNHLEIMLPEIIEDLNALGRRQGD